MSKFRDLTGQKFGKLTVLKLLKRDKKGRIVWLCKCSCGRETEKSTYDLSHFPNVSCKHCRYERIGKKRMKDLTGRRFGRLLILSKIGHKGKGILWLAKCDCGNTHEVTSNQVLSGSCKSCGCLRKEKITKHSLSHTKLYDIWISMRDRCNNPNSQNYKHYGERGIKVCSKWQENFMDFYTWAMENNYKEGLSLDRKDNNKGYTPSNCRWVTQKVQNNNTSRNCLLTYEGVTRTITEWAEALNIPVSRIRRRVKSGWSTEQALFTPIIPYNERYKGKAYS